MSRSQVPVFLLCGGLCESPINTPTEMSRALYDMQLACINTQVGGVYQGGVAYLRGCAGGVLYDLQLACINHLRP